MVLLLFLSLALVGCGGGGGGGGGGSSGPEAPPPANGGGGGSGGPAPVGYLPSPSSCPSGEIPTHTSLGLGCLTRNEFRQNAERIAARYRAHASFRERWGFKAVNADQAYAHMNLLKGINAKAGQGITIGFVDSGIDRLHPAFRGREVTTRITEIFFPRASDETGATEYSHGTFVASIAAGSNGVAWGADVAMLAIPLGQAGEYFEPIRITQGRDQYHSALFARALRMNTDILNVSAGFGIISNHPLATLRANYRQTIKVMEQRGVLDRDKTIFVWAAGNYNGLKCRTSDIPNADLCVPDLSTPGEGRIRALSPTIWAGLAARISELQGHSIAVVATDKTGAIADFSNRCGIAADWCIAAPGKEIRGAYFGPDQGQPSVRGWGTGKGTSLSAPMVSGGLAIMKQLFRGQLGNTELVTRLFATAKKTGIYADRTIYGQGLMDLGAATNPWGVPAFVSMGQSVASPSSKVDTSGTGLLVGSAMGDGFALAVSSLEVAAFDELGAPFWYEVESFVHPQHQNTNSVHLDSLFAGTGRTRTDIGDWQLGIRPGGSTRDFGHLALATDADRFDLTMSDGWSMTYFNRPPQAKSSELSGATMELRPVELPAVALQAGWLTERNSLLGSSASGAFGRLAGRTSFVSVGIESAGPQGWWLTGQGEWGMVRPDASDGLFLRRLSTLRTEAYRVAAHRSLSNAGTLRLALEQPVRVAKGTADLDLPNGRSVDGRVTGESINVGVAPKGRQLDLSARIDYSLGGGELALEGILSRQPNHRADAQTSWKVMMGWRKQF